MGNETRVPFPVSRFPSLPALSAADGYRLFPRGCVDPIHLDEKVLATDILIRFGAVRREVPGTKLPRADRKSTRLNSSHLVISYAVFCLKKKKNRHTLKTTVRS